MARRPVKKTKPQRKGTGSPIPSVSSQAPSRGSGDSSFYKIVILVGVILAVLYGPSLFKKGVTISVPTYHMEDFPLKKIAQFNLNPNPKKTFFVTSVAVVGPNELAVTDSPGCQVLMFDFKGKLLRKWGGKSGKAPNEFQEPSGITSDRKGHMYVMDTWNGAIKAFDTKGKLLKVLDLSHFGFFYGPRWVGWGGDSLLVPNGSNYLLARLSLTGELLNVWQDKNEVGHVDTALGDGKGHFYAGGTLDKKGRIQVYDEQGKVVRTINTNDSPGAMALDSKGRIFVQCGNGSRVYDPDGKLLGAMTDEASPGQNISFNGIDITPDDTILTCGGDMVTIYKISKQTEK